MSRAKRDSHTTLQDCEAGPFVIKGLRSDSIREPAVKVLLNGRSAGEFHGIELFEKVDGLETFPQTVADLISNTYVRLTYQRPDGSTATFGTSIIAAPSFRLNSGVFHFIPEIERVELFTGAPHRLKIVIHARYGDLAKVVCTRIYSQESCRHLTAAAVAIEFEALQDLALDERLRGTDVFRLISFSSMYAEDTCFDASLIRVGTGDDKEKSVPVRETSRRQRYLLPRTVLGSWIELVKEAGSTRPRNTPGSPDSPSVRIEITTSSLPSGSLGAQGYLAGSRDSNDDSLGVWIEWLDAPNIIPAHSKLTAAFKATAFPPAARRFE